MATQYGWLVENGKSGNDLRYRTIRHGMVVWTADHNEALRFARREDAERFAAEDDDAWRIAEHAWAICRTTMKFSRAVTTLQETPRRIWRRLQRLVGLHSHWEAEHYRVLSQTHMKNSQFYQAQLYHAWRVIREQSKGLNRQARKIRRLQKMRHNKD